MSNKVVELIGLSGSGKTTILKKCFSRVGDVQKTHMNVRVVKLKRSNIVIQFVTFIFISIKIFLRSPTTLYYLIFNKFGIGLLFKLSYRGSMNRNSINSKDSTIYIIEDSGVLMPIISSVIEDDILWNKINLTALLDVIKIPDYCIVVNITPDKAYNRFIFRQQTKSMNTAIPVIGDRHRVDSVSGYKFANAERYIHRLKYYLENKKGVTCYGYDNSNEDIDCNEIRRIVMQIKNHKY
jgi:thymidylate kinase